MAILILPFDVPHGGVEVMDAEAHDQRRTTLGAYALGALDEAECEQVDVHLRQCGPCREELGELLVAADALTVDEQEPPAEVWERIRSRLRRRSDQ